MRKRWRNLLDGLLHKRALRRWAGLAEAAPQADTEFLRQWRGRARGLRRHLDRVLAVAEDRLALPAIGSNALRRPIGTDWAWRPDLWRLHLAVPGIAGAQNRTAVTEGVVLFHDCRLAELTARQIRNTRAEDIAPYGLSLDVFRFEGSFLSASIDLPADVTAGLRHVFRMDVLIETERPLETFARLNIRHGPNVEQLVRELQRTAEGHVVEFDLAYGKFNEKRVDKLWIDLIFEGPSMNRIILRDLTLSRRVRAEI